MAVVLPVACWVVLPKDRIADTNLRIELSERVFSLVYWELVAVVIALFSFAGLRRWRPAGIVVRGILCVAFACIGSYLLFGWSFALGFIM